MRQSEFMFNSVDVLYYDLNKISLSRGGSYIDSPELLKNKKATTQKTMMISASICFNYCIKL